METRLSVCLSSRTKLLVPTFTCICARRALFGPPLPPGPSSLVAAPRLHKQVRSARCPLLRSRAAYLPPSSCSCPRTTTVCWPARGGAGGQVGGRARVDSCPPCSCRSSLGTRYSTSLKPTHRWGPAELRSRRFSSCWRQEVTQTCKYVALRSGTHGFRMCRVWRSQTKGGENKESSCAKAQIVFFQ